MNNFKFTLAHLAVFSVIGGAMLAPAVQAQNAPQAVNLVAGWNSVWLEVEPRYVVGDIVNADPAVGGGPEVLAADDPRVGQPKTPWDIFDNPAVLVVATPKPLAGLAEFFGKEPGTIGTFNEAEWLQWKRTDPSGSNHLVTMEGNRPYLVQSSGPATFSLSGQASFFRPTWTPDRYNLVGFGLQGAPSFGAFFGPSGTTHPVAKIFKLNPVSGGWEHVTAGQTMTAGEAYWIFSSGPSSYMGPVALGFDLDITGGLDFGGPVDVVPVGTGVSAQELDLKEIVFTNLGTSAAAPVMDLISVSGAGLALRVVKPATDRIGYDLGNLVDSVLGAGGASDLEKEVGGRASATLTLGAQRSWVTGLVERTNLYRVETGADSASFWLPVSARSTSLQGPNAQLPDAAFSSDGLWVGEVIVDGVTSIVEDGAPVRPTAGTAPMRIVLHSSNSGAVLLSSVTAMQTKTVDPEIAPIPVLVIDPARIPFFEGIKERNGKRVGLRLEAVAYDLPRRLDAASQAAILDDPAYPDLTEAGLEAFILGRAGRPPSLAEVYHQSWPMSGGVGAGQTITTTFTLDPFHRSNPFRHAFHKNEARGPSITRTMTLVFDADQAIADRLRGTFQETVQGLIKSNLEVTGRVELRRISPVSTLEGAP
jgi:hypothetical protein